MSSPHSSKFTSDGVDGHVDPKAHLRVCQTGPDVVLEEVPDAVELHDVGGLLAEPELVELDEEVAVQVVEVRQPGPAKEIELQIGGAKGFRPPEQDTLPPEDILASK